MKLFVLEKVGLRGDKIILPSKIFEQYVTKAEIDSPLTFRLESPDGIVIYAGVTEFTGDDDLVMMSPWLIKSMNVHEMTMITVEYCKLKKGTFAQLEVYDSNFQELSNYRFILESFVRSNLTTLTKGTILECTTPHKVYAIKVANLIANGEQVDGVLVIDTDLEVDIALPLNISHNDDSNKSLFVNQIPFSETRLMGERLYYKIQTNEEIIYINVRCLEGDVNLFVSTFHERPSLDQCEFLSVESGNKQLTVNKIKDQFIYLCVEPYTEKASILIEFGTKEVIQIETRHEETATTETKCPNCETFVPQASFILHQAFCLRNNVKCKRCNQVFKSTSFHEHWHCDLCDAYGHVNIKDKHLKYHHSLRKCVCGIEFQGLLNEYVKHRSTECPKRLIICRYCHVLTEAGANSLLVRDLLQNGAPISQHESECGSRTVECQKCGRKVMIKDVQVHMSMHKLEKSLRPLPFVLCKNQQCSNPSSPKNNLDLCDICFGPFWIAEIDVDNRKLIQRLIARYFNQMSTGCMNAQCLNMYCKSSNIFITLEDSSPNGIALKALELASESGIVQPLTGNKQRMFWFCVDSKTAQLRQMATEYLLPMGYPLEWSIEAVRVGRKEYSKRDENENEDEEKYKNIIINYAVIWLNKKDIL